MTERARAARLAGVVVLVACALIAGVRCLGARGPDGRGADATATGAARPPSSGARAAPRGRDAEASAGIAAPPEPTFAPGISRRERALYTLASYLDWARYPPQSRPIRERPDRVKGHSVPVRRLPLSKKDKAPSKLDVVLSQSHYYLARDEVAELVLRCRQGEEPVACRVTGATLAASPEMKGRPGPPVAVAFEPGGAGAGEAASVGVWRALVTPGQSGFAGAHGPLEITVGVEGAGESGSCSFQLSYTGDPPAVFNGSTSTVVTGGSVRICLGMQVVRAGRYVLDVRVVDVEGRPFALLTFNDELAAGAQEACLVLPGRLILDEGAKGPLGLRDLEGFLLLADAFPDRETVPSVDGTFHEGITFAPDSLSAEEWKSPVKDRTVARLQKDVDEAE